MQEGLTTDALKALLTFPFRGPNWQRRFLTGAGLALAGFLVPFLPGLFVAGYTLDVMRRATRGEEPALPPWDDWGRLALDGLRATAVDLAYVLPGGVVLFGGIVLFFGSLVFSTVLGSGKDNSLVLLAPPVMLAGLVGLLAVLPAGLVLYMLGALPLPVARAHLAARGDVMAAFRVREWWAIVRANLGGFVLAWALAYGLGAVLSTALSMAYYTVVLCCLIPIVTAPAGFYIALVQAGLFGRAYRQGTQPAEAPARQAETPDVHDPEGV